MMQESRKRQAEDAGQEKRLGKSLRIARTPLGRGVFARRCYDAWEVIGEVEGTVIDDPNYGSDYCLDLGNNKSLEPNPPFRFLNHSCDPNCLWEWYDLPAKKGAAADRRVFVLAIHDIGIGEELTIDYGWPADNAIPCRCHAPNCRGWVVAEDELDQVRTLAIR